GHPQRSGMEWLFTVRALDRSSLFAALSNQSNGDPLTFWALNSRFGRHNSAGQTRSGACRRNNVRNWKRLDSFAMAFSNVGPAPRPKRRWLRTLVWIFCILL